MSTYKCEDCRSRHTAPLGEEISCYSCGHVGPPAYWGAPQHDEALAALLAADADDTAGDVTVEAAGDEEESE